MDKNLLFTDKVFFFVIITTLRYFFKQKTAYEIRLSDWSSDVCSSDLTLWTIILIKLFIMFFILKLFFFPSFLGGKTTEEKQQYVGEELIERANP